MAWLLMYLLVNVVITLDCSWFTKKKLLFAKYRTLFKYSTEKHKNTCRVILNSISGLIDNSFPQYASSPARKHVQLLTAISGIIKTNFRLNRPILLGDYKAIKGCTGHAVRINDRNASNFCRKSSKEDGTWKV
jgi:hypothetical protein